MSVDQVDPYLRCGLRANPFVREPDQAWSEPGWIERAPQAPPAPGRNRLVQLIGVRGAGKSTTLRRWCSTAPGPWRYVPPGPGRWRPLPVAPLVYWDEIDRCPALLRRVAWWRAARIGATVVAGSHVDLSAQARRAGLRVDSLEFPPISVAELTAWAQARIALAGGAGWTIPPADAAVIAARAGASWRRAADLMHIWVADRVARAAETWPPEPGRRSPRWETLETRPGSADDHLRPDQ